mgnify:CR=1 FL=1
MDFPICFALENQQSITKSVLIHRTPEGEVVFLKPLDRVKQPPGAAVFPIVTESLGVVKNQKAPNLIVIHESMSSEFCLKLSTRMEGIDKQQIGSLDVYLCGIPDAGLKSRLPGVINQIRRPLADNGKRIDIPGNQHHGLSYEECNCRTCPASEAEFSDMTTLRGQLPKNRQMLVDVFRRFERLPIEDFKHLLQNDRMNLLNFQVERDQSADAGANRDEICSDASNQNRSRIRHDRLMDNRTSDKQGRSDTQGMRERGQEVCNP